MNRRVRIASAVLAFACLVWNQADGLGQTVNESAREIPVAYDVDVVVVGGSCAGVSAAVAAANAGAKVFVAAPRPYLGEDVCATYRLWLEPGEEPTDPLAKSIFTVPPVIESLPFTYEADQPSAGVHKDPQPPTMLADHRWGTAFTESVQYDGDVTITIDLAEPRQFKSVHVMVFQGPRDYEVESVAVSASDDKRQWRQVALIKNDKLGKGSFVHSAIDLGAAVAGRARYFRFFVKKTARGRRVLIGEVIIEPTPAVPKPTGLRVTTPMQVKRALDQALLDAGVSFLYGCYATEVLHDAQGRPAGIVMANRAGRQAVKAKVIVDATDRACVARLAGAAFRPYPAGPQRFTRVVVGGPIRTGKGVAGRMVPLRRPIGGKPPISYGSGAWATKKNLPMANKFDEIIEYTLTIPMKDGSLASFAEAEQTARDRTFHPQQVDESEVLFQVPPDPMKGKGRVSGPWPGASRVDLHAFCPAGVDRVFVLAGCADVPREAAAKLLRPLESIALGSRIGALAAAQAKAAAAPAGVGLRGKPAATVAAGDTREMLAGIRPTQGRMATVPSDERRVPLLGEYDVVVVGGGTAGAPAGVAAARQGAKTLVIEYLHGLGGVATTGLIGIYCAGYRKGFTEETEGGIREISAPSYVVGKMEWWRREIRKAGGHIWFGTLGCGAFVHKGRVKGVVVATPQGRGVVLAKAVVDGTGHADVAAAAGAACMYTDGSHIALQGAGLPQRETGATYINTDWTFVDDSDLIDVWSAFVTAKKRYRRAYDLGQLIDTRERRRIVGDHVLSPLDIINQRTFPDTVGISNGGRLDKHGFTVHPFYMISNWHGGLSYTPYRCLLPKGWDGILVVGLGLSAHCDAIPSIRMQPCMQNLGYAAGVAAAMAARTGAGTRSIDIKALQRHLVERACLTPDVPKHTDSYPLPADRVQAAVQTLADKDYSGLGVIMAAQDRSIPLMRDAHGSTATSAEGKLRCAHVLGILGDPTGADTLIAKARSYDEFDEGRIDDYFPCITWLDSYLIALGRTRDPRALEPVLEKLALLGTGKGRAFSHHRAVAMALESLGHAAAAKPLAAVLSEAGGAGNACTALDEAMQNRRGKSGQRELILARALYRCGDYNGLGEKVLRAYARDVRGHFARHAAAVLAQGASRKQRTKPYAQD